MKRLALGVLIALGAMGLLVEALEWFTQWLLWRFFDALLWG